MITKKDIYGWNTSYRPNTFIGGVGTTISTKSLLATKLGISTTRIKSFRIVNDEVQACIEGNYVIPGNCFQYDTNITWYKDNDRLVSQIYNGSFMNCTNLEVLELYGLKNLSAGGSIKISNTKIEHLYFPEMTSISGNGSIQNNSFLKTFDAPIATAIPNNSTLQNNNNLEYINIPNVVGYIGSTIADNNTFGGCKAGCLINVHISMMTNTGGLPDADLRNTALDVNYIGYTPNPSDYNTEIGGVVLTLANRRLIGEKLGIGSARIVDFSTSGSDIRFRVLGAYTILANAFKTNASITNFKDNSGLCTLLNNNSFAYATNLAEVYFPSVTTLQASGGSTSGVFNDCPNLHTVHMPLLANVNGRRNFANTPKLTSMNLDNVTSNIDTWTFGGSGINHINLPLATSLGQEFMNVNTLTKTFSAPLATTFSVRAFEGGQGLETINIPAVENIPIKNQNFHGLLSLKMLNAKKLKYMGDPTTINGSGGSSAFSGLKMNCVIQVHIDMATVNSGTADISLIWCKTNRNASVEFYDDSGNYVSSL